MLVNRCLDKTRLKALMDIFPVTAILGARQCGKTTLAHQFPTDYYFDLENPRDIVRLETPQLTLENCSGLIVIDEIQRLPELFPLLRFMVDTRQDQKYLVLGSASRNLIQQTSESLAGRIAYYNLSGLNVADVDDLQKLWLRGGYPGHTLHRAMPLHSPGWSNTSPPFWKGIFHNWALPLPQEPSDGSG